MKFKTKKITAILFILLGFSPLLFAIFITAKKEQIHDKMKKQFETESLQTVVQPENEVIWMDNDEIWVNNRLFDIKNKKLENGIYSFIGLFDEDETKLKEIERNTSGKNKEQNKLLAQLLSHLPVFCNPQIELSDALNSCKFFNTFRPKSRKNPFKEILIPPHQVC